MSYLKRLRKMGIMPDSEGCFLTQDEAIVKNSLRQRYDAIVIGSGAGGSTLAYRLSRFGHQILVVERGDFLRPRRLNTSDPIGKYLYHIDVPFVVGGQTKFYGSALYRMREGDFRAVEHENGVSPAWPITYSDVDHYYSQPQ